MRLVYTPIDLEIELEEGIVDIIVIEHIKTYVNYLTSLYSQYNDGGGEIILSDNNNELNISKSAEIVINPVLLSPNDKKVISKLYQELKSRAGDVLQEDSLAVNSMMITYLDKLVETVPYDLSFLVDFDISSLLKMYDVKINTNPENVLERIIEYIKAFHRVCNINIFFFINLKDFLDDEELNMLYEFITYEKVHLVIIESKYCRNAQDIEKYWIVDKDLCIIMPE